MPRNEPNRPETNELLDRVKALGVDTASTLRDVGNAATFRGIWGNKKVMEKERNDFYAATGVPLPIDSAALSAARFASGIGAPGAMFKAPGIAANLVSKAIPAVKGAADFSAISPGFQMLPKIGAVGIPGVAPVVDAMSKTDKALNLAAVAAPIVAGIMGRDSKTEAPAKTPAQQTTPAPVVPPPPEEKTATVAPVIQTTNQLIPKVTPGWKTKMGNQDFANYDNPTEYRFLDKNGNITIQARGIGAKLTPEEQMLKNERDLLESAKFQNPTDAKKTLDTVQASADARKATAEKIKAESERVKADKYDPTEDKRKDRELKAQESFYKRLDAMSPSMDEPDASGKAQKHVSAGLLRMLDSGDNLGDLHDHAKFAQDAWDKRERWMVEESMKPELQKKNKGFKYVTEDALKPGTETYKFRQLLQPIWEKRLISKK